MSENTHGVEIDSVWKHKDIDRKVRVTGLDYTSFGEPYIDFEGVGELLFGGERIEIFLKYYEPSSLSAVRGVVFVSDNEGNNFYVPATKLEGFNDWCERYPDGDPSGDYYEHATLVEGEMYIVDIIDKV